MVSIKHSRLLDQFVSYKKMKCCEYDTCIVKHNGFIMYRYLTNLVCLSFPVKVTRNNKNNSLLCDMSVIRTS